MMMFVLGILGFHLMYCGLQLHVFELVRVSRAEKLNN